MDNALQTLFAKLLSVTEKLNVKWNVGSQKGEYFARISDITIMIASVPNASGDIDYSVRFLDVDGNEKVHLMVTDENADLYDAVSKLYQILVSRDDSNLEFFSEIIEKLPE